MCLEEARFSSPNTGNWSKVKDRGGQSYQVERTCLPQVTHTGHVPYPQIGYHSPDLQGLNIRRLSPLSPLKWERAGVSPTLFPVPCQS